MIDILADKVPERRFADKEEAFQVAGVQRKNLFNLFSFANKIREKFRTDSVDLCAIVNAKSGACPEDCSYCAQSSKSKTGIEVYPLIRKEVVLEKAKEAKKRRKEILHCHKRKKDWQG